MYLKKIINKQTTKIIAVAVVVLWALYSFWLFGHRQVDVDSSLTIKDIYINYFNILVYLFLVLAILFTAAALGRKISKILKINYKFVLEEFLFSTGLGLGGYALILLILGLFKLLYPIVAYALILGLFLSGIKEIKYFILKIKQALSFTKAKYSYLVIICLLFILFQISLSFVGALMPENNGDALNFHLHFAKLFNAEHQIFFDKINPASAWPILVQTLFSFAMLLKDYFLAKLLHFMAAILSVLCIYSFGKKFFVSSKVKILASLLFITLPLIMWESTAAYIDLFWLFFGLLSLYALFSWISSKDNKWLILSGITAGLALGVKLHAMGNFIVLILIIFVSQIIVNRRKLVEIVKKTSIFFVLPALITAAPWYLRGLLSGGNPFYPFFSKSSTAAALFSIISSRAPETALNYFKMPLKQVLSLPGIRCPGVLFLIFIPISFLLITKNKYLKYLLFYAVASYIVWLFSSLNPRYVILSISIFVLPISFSIVYLSSKIKFLKIIIYPLIFLAVLVNMFYIWPVDSHILSRGMPVFLGIKSKQSYAQKYVNEYPSSDWINRNLPTNAVIFGLKTFNPFYIDRTFVDTEKTLDYSTINKETEFLEKLKILNITHIWFSRYYYNKRDSYLSNPKLANAAKVLFIDPVILDRFFKKFTEILYQNDNDPYGFEVYEVVYPPEI